MSTEGFIEAKVEAVVNVGHKAYVIVCLNSRDGFSVFDGSTLGGKPVRPWLTQPRALTSDGKPRYDVYSFTLISKADMHSFQVGEIHPLLVNLAPLERNKAEQEAAPNGGGVAKDENNVTDNPPSVI